MSGSHYIHIIVGVVFTAEFNYRMHGKILAKGQEPARDSKGGSYLTEWRSKSVSDTERHRPGHGPFRYPFVRRSSRQRVDQAAVCPFSASTRGRYRLFISIQWAARFFALSICASGKFRNGTRVGPTLQ